MREELFPLWQEIVDYWREHGYGEVTFEENGEMGPDAKPPYGMCWDGELLLTMFMTPGTPDAEVADPFLEQAVNRSDLSKSGIIRASHVMAAYWRSRALAAKEAK